MMLASWPPPAGSPAPTKCPRCGGKKGERRPAMNDRGDPFRYGPGVQLPRCAHEFHA